MKKVVILTSGGMDSCALNAYLARELGFLVLSLPPEMVNIVEGGKRWEIHPIFFDYGQLSAKEEQKAASEFLKRIGNYKLCTIKIENPTLKIPMTGHGRMPEVSDEDFNETKHLDWVPHRNFIFLTLAAQYASMIGTDTLAISSHKEELFPHPDSMRETFNSIEEALTLSDGRKHRWKILTPFLERGWYKWDIVKWCFKKKIPLSCTYTCYKGQEKHCGVCRGCYDRKQAFKHAGVVDETEYEGA